MRDWAGTYVSENDVGGLDSHLSPFVGRRQVAKMASEVSVPMFCSKKGVSVRKWFSGSDTDLKCASD